MEKKVILKKEKLEKAFAKFSEALDQDLDLEIARDGRLKRFEFTFELAWKYLQAILKNRGLEIASPKGTLRLAVKEGLISEVDLWLEFAEFRNLTSHLYEEGVAEKIDDRLSEFKSLVENLLIQ